MDTEQGYEAFRKLRNFYARRRYLLVASGDSDECWSRMGVAHRHLERIKKGILNLTPGVENEIRRCFNEVELWLNSKMPSVAQDD